MHIETRCPPLYRAATWKVLLHHICSCASYGHTVYADRPSPLPRAVRRCYCATRQQSSRCTRNTPQMLHTCACVLHTCACVCLEYHPLHSVSPRDLMCSRLTQFCSTPLTCRMCFLFAAYDSLASLLNASHLAHAYVHCTRLHYFTAKKVLCLLAPKGVFI